MSIKHALLATFPPSLPLHFPPGKMLVSTGCPEDGHMAIWDWRAGLLLARQPLLAGGTIRACFTEDGSCLISTGKEHFKVWERDSGGCIINVGDGKEEKAPSI